MSKEVLTVLFYIILTIVIYVFFNRLYLKLKSALLNPVLIASCFIILLLVLFKIPYSTYNKGGRVITEFLGPLVVVLAIPLFKNRQALISNFIPIMGGILAGILTTFMTVIGLCKIFNIEYSIMLSIFTKSITTPMAVEATKILGGEESITIIAVALTGILGAGFAPLVIKYGKIKSDIAKGIGIGTSSHAIGTSKAVELGEEIGAASGLAIAVTGITTILLIIVIHKFI
nr:LrgB family protein [Sedimentibacter sp.]